MDRSISVSGIKADYVTPVVQIIALKDIIYSEENPEIMAVSSGMGSMDEFDFFTNDLPK